MDCQEFQPDAHFIWLSKKIDSDYLTDEESVWISSDPLNLELIHLKKTYYYNTPSNIIS